MKRLNKKDSFTAGEKKKETLELLPEFQKYFRSEKEKSIKIKNKK